MNAFIFLRDVKKKSQKLNAGQKLFQLNTKTFGFCLFFFLLHLAERKAE